MRESSSGRANSFRNKVVLVPLIIFSICMFLFTIGSLLYSDTGSKKLHSLYTIFDLKNTALVLSGLLIMIGIYYVITKLFADNYSVLKIRKLSLTTVFLMGLLTVVIYSTLPLNTDPAHLMRFPTDWAYVIKFSYQLPLGLFNSLLVYMFGIESSVLLFRLLNVFLLTTAYHYLGIITQFIFNNERVTKLFYLVAPFCFQFILYVTFCYGSFPGACLMVIATYHLMSWLDTGINFNAAMMILISFVGYAIRLNSIIFIIAYVLILILKFNKKQIIPIISLILMPIITIPIFVAGTNFALEFQGNDVRVKSGYASLSNIAQGLNAWLPEDRIAAIEQGIYTNEQIDDFIGTWSYVINPHAANEMGTDRAQEISKMRIKYRIQEFINDPNMALKYFTKKTIYNWIQPDFLSLRNDMDKRNAQNSGMWFDETESRVMHSIYSGKIYLAMFTFQDIFESFVYLFALLSVFVYHRRRDLTYAVIPLVFIGQVAFSFISETRAIYHYGYFVLLMPYVAAGLCYLCQKLFDFHGFFKRITMNVKEKKG